MKTYIKDIKKLLTSLQKESIEDDIKGTVKMKFQIKKDVELSRAIRKELVRLGLEHPPYSTNFDEAIYLYAYSNEKDVISHQITQGTIRDYYNRHEGIETTLEELKLMINPNEEK